MYKTIITLILALIVNFSFAKKVKFAVNMSGQTVSPNGVHVTGDFQTAAGYTGGNWLADVTLMKKETDTNIYSVIVDIPALKKYEYKFVNGDKFYEVEFVPVESRVGYNFNDNRWLYVDSIANDTTFVGAILFAGNAPAGLTLLRFLVDMQSVAAVSSAGVHVAGNYQNWNTTSNRLYSFGDSVYEIISYVDTGNYEYKYYNGNATINSENVPSSCAVGGNRGVYVSKDTVLNAVCFSKCFTCNNTGFETVMSMINHEVFPNPTNGFFTISFNDMIVYHHITLMDVTGKEIGNYDVYNDSSFSIERKYLEPGVYFIDISSGGNLRSSQKLIVQ